VFGVVPTEQRLTKSKPQSSTASTSTELPYRVELFDDEASARTRVLARAQTSSLARVIFKAACVEYPERTLVLKRGARVIARRTR